MDETERYQRGKAMRIKVLGAAHVERATKAVDEFGEPFQRIVAHEFGWGDIWGRPGLDLKTRSLCTVAMLTAMYRPTELAIHIRGALNNGATKEEIREVLMQAVLYAGAPACNQGFEVARQVLVEYYAGEGKEVSG